MIYFAASLPATICLLFAGYGWVNGLSGWGWWLAGVLVLIPTMTKHTYK